METVWSTIEREVAWIRGDLVFNTRRGRHAGMAARWVASLLMNAAAVWGVPNR